MKYINTDIIPWSTDALHFNFLAIILVFPRVNKNKSESYLLSNDQTNRTFKVSVLKKFQYEFPFHANFIVKQILSQ